MLEKYTGEFELPAPEDTQGAWKTERRFLLEKFPEGLERNHKHIQITDNYITNTCLRLRRTRVPETKARQWMLTQKLHPQPDQLSKTLETVLYLAPVDYEPLRIFEGNEIRKNRYPYEWKGRTWSIDLYLGPLWGLLIAKTDIADGETPFDLPDFAVAEVTDDPLFSGPSLAQRTIDEIRSRFSID
jgi:CYTH domain-containing protein